jgi:hypothetical protein
LISVYPFGFIHGALSRNAISPSTLRMDTPRNARHTRRDQSQRISNMKSPPFSMWRLGDSNPSPLPCKSSALPNELNPLAEFPKRILLSRTPSEPSYRESLVYLIKSGISSGAQTRWYKCLASLIPSHLTGTPLLP